MYVDFSLTKELYYFSKTVSITFIHHFSPGRGALVFEVGYHPRKKIHAIKVVFQDQAMYARTSFRGAKNMQNWKKRVLTNFGKDLTHKLRKTHEKRTFGVYFHT